MRKIVLVLGGLTLLAPPISPCVCRWEKVPVPTAVATAVSTSTLVVLGKVTEVEDRLTWWHRWKAKHGYAPDGSDWGEYVDFYGFRVAIAVEKAWKGASGEATVIVLTGRGGGDCGFPFEVGHSYLIYAHSISPRVPPSTTICDRTQPAEGSRDDIKTLNELSIGP